MQGNPKFAWERLFSNMAAAVILSTRLLSEKITMLLRCQSVDFTAPVCEFATGNFLIDFQRHVIDHIAWLTADFLRIFSKISCTEGYP